MVVTVATVLVVEVAVNQVIHMISMGNCLVSTIGTVLMVCWVAVTTVAGGTFRRVLFAHFEGVLVNMVLMRVMKVTIVQVIQVIAVFDGDMPTTSAVLVIMGFVFFTIRHITFLFYLRITSITIEQMFNCIVVKVPYCVNPIYDPFSKSALKRFWL